MTTPPGATVDPVTGGSNVLNSFDAYLATINQVNAQQNPSTSLDIPASQQFALANQANLPPTDPGVTAEGQQLQQAQLLAQYNAGTQAADLNPVDQYGQSTVDPVTGIAPPNPVKKHRGLLSGVLHDTMQALGASDRFKNHLSRLATDAGIPGWVQGATIGLGGAIGAAGAAVIGAPILATAGVGAAIGVGAAGLVGAEREAGSPAAALKDVAANIEGRNHNDLSAAWQRTMHGETMGQIIADSIGLRNPAFTPLSGHQGVAYRLLSGTADLATTMATDPTMYLAPMFKAARGAVEISGAMNDEAILRATVEGNPRIQKFMQWAVGQSPWKIMKMAEGMGAPIPDRVALALSQAGDAADASEKFVQAALQYGGTSADKYAIDAIPAMYKSPVLRLAQSVHAWDGPSLFHIVPQANLNLEDPDIVTQAHRVFETWAPGMPQEYINGMTDQFIQAGDEANGARKRLQLLHQAYTDGLRSAGITDDQIDRMAEQNNWLTTAKMKMSGKILKNGDPFVVPGYADMRKANDLFASGGIVGSAEKLATNVTNAIKPLWLMRPAFAIRLAMDEGLAAMAKFNISPIEFLGAQADAWAKYYTNNPDAFGSSMSKVISGAYDLLGNIPGLHALTPADPADWVDLPKQILSGGFDRAAETGLDDSKEAAKYVEQSATQVGRKGEYIKPGEVAHARAWHQILNYYIRNDPVGYAALEQFDNPAGRLGAAQEVEDALKAAGKPASDASKMVRLIYGDTDTMSTAMVPDSLRPMLYADRVSINDLRDIPIGEKPVVWGDASVPKEKGLLNSMKEGFHHMTSTWINNNLRGPAFQIEHKKLYTSLLERATESGAIDSGEVSASDLSRQATNNVSRNMLKVIHNPSERTRFDVLTKSFLPFNYAWTQFVKRWANVFEENPAFVRGLSNLVSVGSSDGWFNQNQYGELEFHMPIGNEFAQNFLALNIPKSSVPFVPPMLPFSAQAMPGFSPVMTIPAAYLTRNVLPTFSKVSGIDTEKVNSIENFLFGPSFGKLTTPGYGFLNSALANIAPSWASKLGDALSGNQRDAAFGKSMIAAMTYYWMKGEFNPPARLPNESDAQYQQRTAQNFQTQFGKIRHTTQLLYAVQSALSFFSPYSPLPNTSSMQIPLEYKQMVTQYGYELGVTKFLEKYGPQAESYVQGLTTTSTKGTEPTKEFQSFYNKNSSLFEKYPDVAAFLAPQGGAFDAFAYQAQQQTGQRVQLTPTEWLGKVAILSGDNEFYNNVKPIYDQYVAAGFGRNKVLLAWYNQQKQLIEDKYPGWLAWRNGAAARESNRQAAIQQVVSMVNDPAAEKIPGIQPLQTWMTQYFQAKNALAQIGYASFSDKHAEPVRTYLTELYHQMSDPSKPGPLDQVYNYIFRFELEDYGLPTTQTGTTGVINGQTA